MPVPAKRSKLLPARGLLTTLLDNIDQLREGEIAFATDTNEIYIKEDGNLQLVAGGASSGGGGGIEEAPLNAGYYVRGNSQWQTFGDAYTAYQNRSFDGGDWTLGTADTFDDADLDGGDFSA